jgi:hypothetical protein
MLITAVSSFREKELILNLYLNITSRIQYKIWITLFQTLEKIRTFYLQRLPMLGR